MSNKRAIYAEDIKETLRNEWKLRCLEGFVIIKDAIDNAETAEVANKEDNVAQWILVNTDDHNKVSPWTCSNCHYENKELPRMIGDVMVDNPFAFDSGHYCPSCGRRMIGSKEKMNIL